MKFNVPAYVSVGSIPVGIMYGRTKCLYEQQISSEMDKNGVTQIEPDKILAEKVVMSSKYMHLVGNVDSIPKNNSGMVSISIATEDGKSVDIIVKNAKFKGEFTNNSALVRNSSIEMSIGESSGNGYMTISFPEGSDHL